MYHPKPHHSIKPNQTPHIPSVILSETKNLGASRIFTRFARSIRLRYASLRMTMIVLFFITITSPIYAENLRSDTYRVDMGTVNMTGGRKESSSYNLTDTVGQTFQGQFDSNGYRVRAGFQYIHSLIRFSFTISDLTIDLGTLTPQTPSTATNTLTISTGNAYGYTVKAIENHELRANNNDVPDTACDAATTCTTTDANVWASNTDYGFGYNMSGDDVDTTDFVDSTYFRPFSNDEDADSPSTVMSSTGIATSSAATVTYKANISATQPAGYYTTPIRFIAIPSF